MPVRQLVMKRVKKLFIHWSIFVFVVGTVSFFLRIALWSQPLTRDEGAYAYVALGLLRGRVPYLDVWDHKPPGVYFIYALVFFLWGKSVHALHLLAALCIAVAVLLVYLIGQEIFGDRPARVGAILFAASLLTTDGTGINTELFMVVCILVSILVCLQPLRHKNSLVKRSVSCLLGGGFFGFAAITKQVAAGDLAGFAVFWGVYTFVRRRRSHTRMNWLVALFMVGLMIPAIAVFAFFWHYHGVHEMWFDTFVYNSLYARISFRARFINGFFATLGMISKNPLLWIGAFGATLMILFDTKARISYKAMPVFWWVGGFIGLSLPGRFFEHYYIQILAPMALLSGYVLHVASEKVKRCNCRSLWTRIAVLLFVWVSLNWLGQYLTYYRDSYHSLERSQVRVANFVREHTNPEETVFIWGAEPQIYFVSGRYCASRYINFYPFVRQFYTLTGADRLLIQDLETNKPALILIEISSRREGIPNFLRGFLESRYKRLTRVENMIVYRRSD